jgi:hypothetical protein
MTHEGIEFVIRAGLGRDQWTVLIYFPDASDALARSSVVRFTGTRDEARAVACRRIDNWLKKQQREGVAKTRRNRP